MVSRFRVKKLSPKHPLPVYKESQLPDLTDPANLQRSVPQIETGVEKEEEEEVSLYIICRRSLGSMCCMCLYVWEWGIRRLFLAFFGGDKVKERD
jgi:hypothetical protein